MTVATAAPSRLEGPVRRVIVLRALVLGDLLCAVPALRALRAALPQARISLLGLPWAQEFVRRCPYVDEWIALPGWPGLTEQAPDLPRLPGFLAEMQSRRFDLALQLHGSGGLTNPLLALLGARQNAGFFAPGAWRPPADLARFAPWPEQGHEIDRLLRLPLHLGMPAQGRELEFWLQPEDHARVAERWPMLAAGRPYVCVHAGAQLASRRWPVERFAAVADALADAGFTVVLTGSPAEQALGARLAQAMDAPCLNLTGQTELWTLGALLRGARALLCNDTGVSHIAAALRVPSVVVSSGGDAARWAPLDRQRHRVLAKPAPCRPCAFADCPTGHECALALSVDEVIDTLQTLLMQQQKPLAANDKEAPHDPAPAHPHLARPRQLPLQPDAGAA